MIRVISVISVPLTRSSMRPPIAGPYTQLIIDLFRIILAPDRSDGYGVILGKKLRNLSGMRL
jgi:hypothetical protein